MAYHDKGVGEPLHAEAHRAVSHVAPPRLLHGVEVHVDHAVQVARHHLRHLLLTAPLLLLLLLVLLMMLLSLLSLLFFQFYRCLHKKAIVVYPAGVKPIPPLRASTARWTEQREPKGTRCNLVYIYFIVIPCRGAGSRRTAGHPLRRTRRPAARSTPGCRRPPETTGNTTREREELGFRIA